jgi:uncharacterized protein
MTQSTPPARLAPVSDRLHLIDALRGAALFGVIAMNLVAMVAGLIGGEIFARATPVDLAFASFDLVFLQGKARSTFALLFGVGFGILMSRAAARGDGFTGFYMRRMAALLLFGVLNLAFLFWGDILILYALLGMVLLAFRRLGDRAVLALGLALVIVPPLVAGAVELAIGGPLPNLAGLSPAEVAQVMPASVPAYRGEDFGAYVRANLAYYVDHWRAETSYAAMYALGVLGLFLLGLWTTRVEVLADVERWRPLLRWLAWTCLPFGLILSIIHASRRMGIEIDGAGYALVTAAYVGLPIMAFGYIAALALLLTRAGRWLQPALAPVGRMALTGYLGSNAIGSFVWYGWGLGLMGAWNGAAMNLFAVAVFIGLAVFAALWLAVFRFGPVEWVWRCLSYGRLQPLLRRRQG